MIDEIDCPCDLWFTCEMHAPCPCWCEACGCHGDCDPDYWDYDDDEGANCE